MDEGLSPARTLAPKTSSGQELEWEDAHPTLSARGDRDMPLKPS